MRYLIGLGAIVLDKLLALLIVCGLIALFVAYPLPTAVLLGALIIGVMVAASR